jgi:hypothetical protein
MQLPDDIEQKLLDGQRRWATSDLAERRAITLDEARLQIGRWLFDRQQALQGGALYGRRRGDRPT